MRHSHMKRLTKLAQSREMATTASATASHIKNEFVNGKCGEGCHFLTHLISPHAATHLTLPQEEQALRSCAPFVQITV
jgi:hypothetical protein